MVDGINVLSEQVVPIMGDGNFAIGFWVTLIVVVGLGIYMGNELRDITVVFQSIVLGIMCGFLVGVMTTIVTEKQIGEYKKYKVTIHEDVSLKEFNEKYEILEIEGKIYTIKEKETE